MAYFTEKVSYILVPNNLTITTNQDNYSIVNGDEAFSLIKLMNSTSSLDITGFIAQEEGFYLTIYNSINSTYNIVLKHDTTSTAENRIDNRAGADITLAPGEFTILLYLDERWRC